VDNVMTGSDYPYPLGERPVGRVVRESEFLTGQDKEKKTAGTVTCPNGATRRITPNRAVVFGVPCRGCPLRARCTTSKSGRSLRLYPRHALLRQARRDWRDNDELRALYRSHRPMVERSIAWLIGPEGRCRKLRCRGVAAGDWWLHTRMAGLNLRRLLNLGLVRHDGAWALV
jgi:hypothetical protein